MAEERCLQECVLTAGDIAGIGLKMDMSPAKRVKYDELSYLCFHSRSKVLAYNPLAWFYFNERLNEFMTCHLTMFNFLATILQDTPSDNTDRDRLTAANHILTELQNLAAKLQYTRNMAKGLTAIGAVAMAIDVFYTKFVWTFFKSLLASAVRCASGYAAAVAFLVSCGFTAFIAHGLVILGVIAALGLTAITIAGLTTLLAKYFPFWHTSPADISNLYAALNAAKQLPIASNLVQVQGIFVATVDLDGLSNI